MAKNAAKDAAISAMIEAEDEDAALSGVASHSYFIPMTHILSICVFVVDVPVHTPLTVVPNDVVVAYSVPLVCAHVNMVESKHVSMVYVFDRYDPVQSWSA